VVECSEPANCTYNNGATERGVAGDYFTKLFATGLGGIGLLGWRRQGASRRLNEKRLEDVEKVHALTARSRAWQETTVLVTELNRTLRGWANYFRVGTITKAYRTIDYYAVGRLRRWLR
jgi:hypothetical protein